MQDLDISLSDWGPLDAVVERFRGRFSLSSDYASKFGLVWLLMHTTLLHRGITRHRDLVMISYEDLLTVPGKVSARLSDHLRTDVALADAPPHQKGGREFFRDSIDVELARDCMALFDAYRDASRQ